VWPTRGPDQYILCGIEVLNVQNGKKQLKIDKLNVKR
jgi:hypothetical protein